jgi:hypothetical protein
MPRGLPRGTFYWVSKEVRASLWSREGFMSRPRRLCLTTSKILKEKTVLSGNHPCHLWCLFYFRLHFIIFLPYPSELPTTWPTLRTTRVVSSALRPSTAVDSLKERGGLLHRFLQAQMRKESTLCDLACFLMDSSCCVRSLPAPSSPTHSLLPGAFSLFRPVSLRV